MSIRLFSILLGCALAAAPVLAQTAPAAVPAGQASYTPGLIPANTQISLKLDSPISTKTATAGQTFSAHVTAPVLDTNGQISIPLGSVVEGTVESAQAAGGLTGNSNLQLRFDRVVLPNGRQLALRASLSGVNENGGVGGLITGTPAASSEGGVQQSRTRSTVGTVAAGGAVGALLGAIAGGGKGAAIGTAAGAGLGVLLASRQGDLNLPAGTPMTITLSSPLRVH